MGSSLHSVSPPWSHTIGLEWDGVALDQDQKSIFLCIIRIHLDSRLDAMAYSNKLISWLAACDTVVPTLLVPYFRFKVRNPTQAPDTALCFFVPDQSKR
jgi:hypothetical protein